jgi:hypothetical protein
MLLDGPLNLRLQLGCDVPACDLLEQHGLARRQVRAELGFPLGDLVDGDRVELMGMCM